MLYTSKNAYNNSLCNLFPIKIQLEGFVNRIREREKKSQKGNTFFGVGPVLGGVERSITNQHFLSSALA